MSCASVLLPLASEDRSRTTSGESRYNESEFDDLESAIAEQLRNECPPKVLSKVRELRARHYKTGGGWRAVAVAIAASAHLLLVGSILAGLAYWNGLTDEWVPPSMAAALALCWVLLAVDWCADAKGKAALHFALAGAFDRLGNQLLSSGSDALAIEAEAEKEIWVLESIAIDKPFISAPTHFG